MALLGRVPGTPDSGGGEMLSGRQRASIMGTVQSAGWVRRFGFRAGRNTASNSSAAMALYKATSTVVTDLVAQTASVPVTTPMDGNGYGGTNHYQTVTGVPVSPNQNYALALRVLSTSLAYGQDNSGHPMHFKTATTFASPYGASSVSAQGKMSLWLEIDTNHAPAAPTMISPANNAAVADTTPTITVRHNDLDTAYGDYMRYYKIELWDATNTNRLQTSGQATATTAQHASGVAEWTPALLTAGRTYTIRAHTYDYHGVISPATTTKFTVNTGGAFSSVTLLGMETKRDANGYAVLDDTVQPTVRLKWQHADGINTSSITLTARRMDTSEVYRAARTASRVVAPNGETDIVWADGTPAWADLARQNVPLRIEAQAVDAAGGASAIAQSESFVVNPRPTVPGSPVPMSGKIVSEAPVYRFRVTDPNDQTEDLGFLVTLSGPNGALRTYGTADMRYVGEDQWEVPISAADLIDGYATYTVNVRVYDPYGDTFTATAGPNWTFGYVAPPALAITNPTDEQVIASGTPNITWTLDRPQVRRWVRVWRPGQVYDTGWETTASLSHQVPPMRLSNNQYYDVRIDVETSDGLSAWTHTQFRVQYPQPAAMTGVTVTAVASSVFDNGGSTYGPQYPNIRVAWTPVTTDLASNEDWRGVKLERTTAGKPTKTWLFIDRNQNEFTDTSVENGVLYTWTISYAKEINSGYDVIDSTPVVLTVAPLILYPTLTSDDPSDPAVTMHFWRDITAKPETDHEEVPSWGELPFLFQGPKFQGTISGTFRAMDDDTGLALYTARQIAQAVAELQRPMTDQNGRRTPKTVNYRDDRTSLPGVSVLGFSEDYDRNTRTTTFSIRLAQYA